MLVHHLSKAEAQSGEGEGYRGATAWQGGVRYFWRLQDSTLQPMKMSYAIAPDSVILDRDKPGAKGTWQLAADQTPEEESAGRCGAETRGGTPCKARGSSQHGGRCAQHEGQPAMDDRDEEADIDTSDL